MGESDGLFDNKPEINGDSQTKMVGPFMVLFDALEGYDDFDRYNKLISGNLQSNRQSSRSL